MKLKLSVQQQNNPQNKKLLDGRKALPTIIEAECYDLDLKGS